VFEIEKIRCPANVVVIEMSKADNRKLVFVRRLQIFTQEGRQVATAVILVVRIAGICVIEEDLSTVV
jgi:hypothetical protein